MGLVLMISSIIGSFMTYGEEIMKMVKVNTYHTPTHGFLQSFSGNPDHHQKFADYIAEHNKNYPDVETYEKRFKIFMDSFNHVQ